MDFEIQLPEEITNLMNGGGLPSPEMMNFYVDEKDRIFFIDFEIDQSLIEIERKILLLRASQSAVQRRMESEKNTCICECVLLHSLWVRSIIARLSLPLQVLFPPLFIFARLCYNKRNNLL